MLDYYKGILMEELIDNLVVAAKDSATLSEKERCFHLTINTIGKSMVPWPLDVDSKLWNERLDRLINSMIDAFDMEAK
jgi:hypothetical protein